MKLICPKNADSLLQNMPKQAVRDLIHKTGIRTFPRPEGIPSDYLTVVSKTGAGMKYVHPKDPGTSIRIMPGKPHSPYPCQRKPYVIQIQKDKCIDKYGNIKPSDHPDVHIPLNEYRYKF